MSQIALSPGVARAQSRPRRVLNMTRFSWFWVAFCFWFMAGTYMDAWAHARNWVDTFFTPWHGILYAGMAALLMLTVAVLGIRKLSGYAWNEVVPRGYGWAMVGITMILFTGPADLTWHTLFGIEKGVEALLSPSHLTAMVAATLILTGPLRSAWITPNKKTLTWRQDAALLCSLALIVLFEQIPAGFTNIFADYSVTAKPLNQITLSNVIIQTIFLIGFLTVITHRFKLPKGGVVFVFGLPMVSNIILFNTETSGKELLIGFLVGAIVLTWLVGETLVQLYYSRKIGVRLLAIVLPVLLYASFFLAQAIAGQISWTVHVWTGLIFVAGLIGWFTSYLARPDKTQPEEAVS
jgi:hypothetical protein